MIQGLTMTKLLKEVLFHISESKKNQSKIQKLLTSLKLNRQLPIIQILHNQTIKFAKSRSEPKFDPICKIR